MTIKNYIITVLKIGIAVSANYPPARLCANVAYKTK
jgi:hypothetical protein